MKLILNRHDFREQIESSQFPITSRETEKIFACFGMIFHKLKVFFIYLEEIH